jgi:hypothetical protein
VAWAVEAVWAGVVIWAAAAHKYIYTICSG